jgi:hypothetical protein
MSSFVFQGFHSSGKWVTLDERHTPYEVPQHYAIRLYYVDTDCYFPMFRLMMTRSGAFALTCFDIHGAIQLTTDLPLPDDTGNCLKDDPVFDPWGFPEME